MKACKDLKFILDLFLVYMYVTYRCIHKFENYFTLICDVYMRCIITYLGLKIRFNMIHDLYMRYMMSCYDLNFCLDLNFTYIYEIYACILNLKISFMI